MSSLNRAALNMSGAMLGLILLSGGTGIWAAWQQSDALQEQMRASDLLRNHMEADMMHDAIRSDVLAALQAGEAGSSISLAEVKQDLEEHLDTLRGSIADDSAFKGSEDVEQAVNGLEEPMNVYAQAATDMVAKAASNRGAAVAELPQFFTQFRALENSMSAASEAIDGHSAQVAKDGARLGNFAIVLLIIMLVAGIAAAGILSMLVRRHLVTPLLALVDAMRALGSGQLSASIPHEDRKDELGEMAKAMISFRDQLDAAEKAKEEQTRLIVSSVGTGLVDLAAGDLTSRIEADLTGPFAQLKTDFNEAAEKLSALIGAVTQGAESIRTGTTEIARASEDLARRTESNAASLEQTSASVTQMDHRLKTTATTANDTVQRADGTIAVVGSGRALADEAVQAMGRVSESATGIDSVIEGLDKIAFQTRVLAMNAAVEAGRAGDAGRGFAVVADLVSALAMRAEDEAKRARDQLTVTQSEIVMAVDAVQKVDGALQSISGNVTEVHDLLSRIAADNHAQASAISEISSATSTMDHATQQNAAMVEQTSAAARNLMDEVAALADRASLFRVERGTDNVSYLSTPKVRKPASRRKALAS